MKTNKASKSSDSTQNTPATFKTPHEEAQTKKAAKAAAPAPAVAPKAKGKKAAEAPKPETKPSKKTERDAFGGRIGTRMSKINVVVIEAGKKGATVPEVAEKTKESAGLVSAQLGWIVNTKKLATRTEETTKDGKKVFRYFAKIS